jgi:Holliday junction resolvase
MTARSKRKGSRIEREHVNALRELGFDAERVPLSGGAGGSFTGDLVIRLPIGELRAESKGRKSGSGFKTLEKWLGSLDVLFLKRNNAAPFVAMPWATFTRLLGGAK